MTTPTKPGSKYENVYIAIFVIVAVTIGVWYYGFGPGVRSASTPAPAPAQALRYATLVGFDEAGSHVTDIWLREKPAGSYGTNRTVFTAHEGDRVAVLEQLDNGAVRVRTTGGAEGWTQIDALKDIR